MSERATASLPPIVRVPKAADLVAEHLRRQIIRGDLAADEPLPAEAELMHLYNVSRPTLREALRMLEHEELIVVRRGARGAGPRRTPSPRPAPRRTCSSTAGRRCRTCSQPGGSSNRPPCASSSSTARTRRSPCSSRRTRSSARCATTGTATTSLRPFHARVVEAGGNQTLILVNEFMLSIVQHHHRAMFRRSEDQFEGLVTKTIDEHRHLLDLVHAGDADGAEALWRSHLDRAAAASLRSLGERRVIDLFEEV